MSIVGSNALAGASGQSTGGGSGGGGGGGFQIDRSLRFNDGDSPSVSKSFGSAGDRKKWTWSGWFKRGSESQPGRFFSAGPSSTNRTNIFLYPRSSSLGIGFYSYVNGSLVGQAGSVPVLADHSAWYHLVFAFDAANSTTADRLKIYINGVQQSISYSVNVSNIDHYVSSNVAHYVGKGADGYPFDGYLAEVHFVDGQALAATDFGAPDGNNNWNPIAFSGSYGSNGFYLKFADNSSKAALGTDSSGNNNTFAISGLTAAGNVSTSAITNVGSTTGTVSYSDNNSNAYDPANLQTFTSGQISTTPSNIRHVKISDLGTGSIALTHVSGNNFYITGSNTTSNTNSSALVHSNYNAFTINSSFGYAYARIYAGGSGNITYNATVTGPSVPVLTTTNNNNYSSLAVGDSNADGVSITAINSSTPSITVNGGSWSVGDVFTAVNDGDSLLDSPTNYDDGTNVGGNYAVMNPLNKGSAVTLSNGNLDFAASSGSAWQDRFAFSTIGVTSGKWYAEATITDIGSNQVYVGIVGDPVTGNQGTSLGYQTNGFGYYSAGSIFWEGGQNTSATAFTTNDVIGVALDVDNLTVKFYRNGSLVGTRTELNSGKTWFFASDSYSTSGMSWNFGQRSFINSSVPSDHVSLCTQNFDPPTIADGSTAFDAFLYEGNGASSRNLTLPLAADLVWIKKRSASTSNQLADTVRGNNAVLRSNSTAAEGNPQTDFTGGGISSISGTTATISAGTSTNDNLNAQNATFVGWAWDAGSAANPTSISVGSTQAASTVSSGNAYSVGWAGVGSNTWANTDSWSGLSAVSNNAKGYFSGTENLSDGSQISVANGSFSAGNSGSNGWVLRASSTVTIDFTTYSNVTEIATTSSDSQTFADRTIVATNPATGSSVVATGKCFWFKNASQMSVSHINIVNDAPAVPSIASTVRANPSAGFSIVQYTLPSSGTFTVGHGLNAEIGMIIMKDRGRSSNWNVWHSAFTSEDDYINLSSSGAKGTATDFWGASAPGSSTFGGRIGTSGLAGNTEIAYCFAPVEGYSAFGTYTGNGNADGPFVYTGMRSAWIMVKRTDGGGGNWTILDNARNTSNPADALLFPNLSDGEATTTTNRVDLTSNGFKLRGAGGNTNASGGTYVYAAFAEHPLRHARAR